MTVENIITVLGAVGYILLGGLALYLNTKGNLKEKAAGFIADAEEQYQDATKAGGAKFEWAVEQLYGLVPKVLKPLITRKVIGQIVQFAFEKGEAYAKMQLDKFANTLQARRMLQ